MSVTSCVVRVVVLEKNGVPVVLTGEEVPRKIFSSAAIEVFQVMRAVEELVAANIPFEITSDLVADVDAGVGVETLL